MMETASLPKARTRDAARTREAILRAAQKLFAQKGYSTTGVREVATEAGVNSALVRRYFGSKEGLLRQALEGVLRIEPFIHGRRSEFGRRAAAILLAGETIPSPLAMMVLATADPVARSLCSDLMHERIVVPLADWLGGADALNRAVRLNILWVGFMTTRQILPLPPLSAEALEPTLRWLEEASQAVADGREPARR
jgi:AcrR family transcriptional regulator